MGETDIILDKRHMTRVVVDHYSIRIYFGNVLHVYIKRSEFLGLQSWSDSSNEYSIEFALVGGSLIVEYDEAEKWLEILKAMDGILLA